MSERKQWIDICKGIAIVLVVMGHVGNAYNGELKIIHDVIYFFHMPLFMFIGGYLGNLSKVENFKENCKRKIVAYGVPYVVFSVLYWFFKLLGNTFVNNPTDTKELLLIPIYPISFMWYIYALLFIVLFVELLKKHFKYYKQIVMISSILCYIVWLMFMDVPEFADSIFKDMVIIDVIKNYIWYALGYCVGDNIIEACQYIVSKKSFAVLLSVIGYIILFIVGFIDIVGVSVLNIIWGIIGITSTVIICMAVEKNKIIEFLGRNTLPIYVLHGTVTSVGQLVLSKIGITVDVLLIIMCTVAGIIIPVIGYEICKKIWWLDIWFYPNKYIDKRS